jgi:hypothetical protein
MRSCSMLLSSVVLASVAMGAGCISTGSDPADDQPLTSGIQIPLVQQVNGSLYKLAASFQITSPDGTVQTIDASGDEPDVTVQVSPGLVGIRILDGWTLSRSTDGGTTFTKVDAVLGTTTQVNLLVLPDQLVTWQFDFILRDPNVELHIRFGVIEQSHRLTGELFVSSGFGPFAPYRFSAITVAIYFNSFSQTVVEADGTHARQYFSGSSALEFFGDTHGQLAPLASAFTGGFLNFTTRVHPDGTQDASGTYQGFGSTFPLITFDVGQMFGQVDDNGFPADAAFTMFGNQFALTSSGSVAMTGSVDLLDHAIVGPGTGGGGGMGM